MDDGRKGSSYKRYLSDPTLEIPSSTKHWRKKNAPHAHPTPPLPLALPLLPCEDALPEDHQAFDDSSDSIQQGEPAEPELDSTDIDRLQDEELLDLQRNMIPAAPLGIGGYDPEQASPAFSLFGYSDAEAEMPIYPGASLNRGQLLALVVGYVMDSGVSGRGLQKLLELLNVMVPGCVPKSSYFLNKTSFHWADKAELHFHCPNCESYLGTTVGNPECPSCGNAVSDELCRNGNNFFLVMPLAHQIMELLKDPSLQDSILTRNIERRDRASVKEDVTSGDLYQQRFTRNVNNLTLSLNTDGASVFKSSGYSIWPILCTVNELPLIERSKHVLLNSLWFGPKKPNVDTYFEPFTTELQRLYATGLDWVDKEGVERVTKVAVLVCICDAVARAMVQKFKQFNGVYGCGFCLHKGECVAKGKGHTRVYPHEDPMPALRTHNETIEHATAVAERGGVADEKGVKGASPLLLLPKFDIVKGFVPEYMHSVCLGVTKQFVSMWTEGRAGSDRGCHISSAQLGAMDECLAGVIPPNEVIRSPRPLKERHYWKASEWRAFLVFYSPIVLKGVLPKRFYQHWLLFVFAIYTLLLPQVAREKLDKVSLCLFKFVVEIPELYGKEYVSYNVHSMLHLVDCVKRWGLLWSNSAFVFENINGKLMDLFYGTQGVPFQMFKYFFARNKLQKYAPDLFSDAADLEYSLMASFVCNNIWSRHTVSFQEGTAGLGKPKLRLLTEEEKAAVIGSNIDMRCRISEKLGTVFQRAVISSKLYSTKQYANNFKRNNSVVQLRNGLFAQIYAFISLKANCPCLEGCACSDLLVFCNTLSKSRHQMVTLDHYSGVNLLQHIVKVEESPDLSVCSTADIQFKCILIDQGGFKYVIGIPKFETD